MSPVLVQIYLLTWEFCLKRNDVTFCIRGIAVDASGGKRQSRRERIFFPIKKGGEAGNNLHKLGNK